MNIKTLLVDFALTFIVTLVVVVIATFLWSLVFHGAGTVDWETSFRFATILGVVYGIALPWMKAREDKIGR